MNTCLFFIFISSFFVGYNVNFSDAYGELNVNKKIVVLVDDEVSAYHYEHLILATRELEKLWGTKEQFEFHTVNLNNNTDLENHFWRTILVYEHKNPKTKHGKSKSAATSRKIGQTKSGKEIFKARIALKKDEKLLDEIYLHELGHVFGLLHVKNKHNIMCAKVYKKSKFNERQLQDAQRIALGYVQKD